MSLVVRTSDIGLHSTAPSTCAGKMDRRGLFKEPIVVNEVDTEEVTSEEAEDSEEE